MHNWVQWRWPLAVVILVMVAVEVDISVEEDRLMKRSVMSLGARTGVVESAGSAVDVDCA